MYETIKPAHEFNEQELLTLFLFGKNSPLIHFAFSSLAASRSRALDDKAEIFFTQPITRLPIIALKNFWDFDPNTLVSARSDLVDFMYLARHPRMNSILPVLCKLIENRAETLRVNVSLHSYLRNLLTKNHINLLTEVSSRPNIPSSRDPVIAAITFVKNEGRLPHLLAEHILNYCDFLIISDASQPRLSTDPALKNPRIKLIDQGTPFNEARVYDELFSSARNLGSTHILHIDVDERISQTLSPERLRSFAAQMRRGDCLAVPWQQIWRRSDKNYVINFDRLFALTQHPRHIPPYKDLLFCDDGHSTHRPFQLHCPFAPTGFPKQRTFIDDPLLHLEGLAPCNVLSKHNRYWSFDYDLNNNEGLAYHRYLSSYLKLSLLLNSETATHLLDPLNEETPAEYTAELSKKKFQQDTSSHTSKPRDHIFAGFHRFSFCISN